MHDREAPGAAAGDPAGGPGAGRRLRSAGAAMIAVTLLAAPTACAGGGHPPGRRTPSAGRATQTAPCSLRVVESAVTRKDHYSAGVREPDGDLYLASAIVENPCRRAAVNAKFVVSPLDGQGRQLLSGGGPVQEHFTLPLMMPGQRLAGWTYFTHREAPSGVVDVKVRPATGPDSVTCWTDSAIWDYHAVANATGIVIGKRDGSRSLTNGETDVAFTVTWSPAKSPLGKRGASLIFRDSSGRLLDANGQNISANVKRGERVHFTAWAPANADPARTDVILEPEPDTQGLLVSPSPSCLTSP